MSPSTNGHAPEDHGRHDSVNMENDEQNQVATYWSRFEHVKYGDVMKNILIEDVINRYEFLMRKHRDYVQEHQNEVQHARDAVRLLEKTTASLLHMQMVMNRKPFIMVLLDGDGMIFNSKFLSQGETGGRQAAAALHKIVAEWSHLNIVDIPSDVTVIVRCFANLGGLATTCARAGIVDSPARVEEFARGFTQGKALFDFTDVGTGKDRADGKIAETFKLFLYDYHCRQVVLGCSHDNGYARLLEEYADDPEALPRTTLLEGAPFAKELKDMPFQTVKFPGLFRDKLIGPEDLLTGARARIDSRGLNAESNVFTPRIASPANLTSPITSAPRPTASLGIEADIRNTSLVSTISTDTPGAATPGPSVPAASTWAGLASKRAAEPMTDLARPAPVSPPQIRRNRAGQRLDKILDYDRDEVNRLKKLKACNQHYIGVGCCHYNAGKEDKCPHDHRLQFCKQELKWLRVVARETPCKKGHECADVECIYGHRCPFPVATEGSMRDVGCLNGETCRFPRSMHAMDTQEVRMAKIT